MVGSVFPRPLDPFLVDVVTFCVSPCSVLSSCSPKYMNDCETLSS